MSCFFFNPAIFYMCASVNSSLNLLRFLEAYLPICSLCFLFEPLTSHMSSDEISGLDFKLIVKWCKNSLIKCWHLLDSYLGWFHFLAWKHAFPPSNVFKVKTGFAFCSFQAVFIFTFTRSLALKIVEPFLQCTRPFYCPNDVLVSLVSMGHWHTTSSHSPTKLIEDLK